jgi:hypothetical protein
MGVQISKLTYFIKCACDLLIIIAKQPSQEIAFEKS